jgi:hypothetical protein
MRVQTWAMAAAAAWLAGCSSKGSGPVNQPIGAAGGVVSTSDGTGTSVNIPNGAVSTTLVVSVSSNPGAPAPGGAMAVGTPYLFGPEGTQFQKPVTVTVPYDPAKLPAGMGAADVAVFTAPAGSSAYQALPTNVVDATHVSAQTTHFSNFVAAVVNESIADGGTPLGDGSGPSDGPTNVSDGTVLSDATVPTDGAICSVTCNSAAATVDGGTASGTRCSCTSICAGHTYSLNCGQYLNTNLANCECSVDGTVNSSVHPTGVNCANGTTWFPAYQTTCGYPGTLPAT